MPLFSFSIALLTGLCLYAGVHFAFHYRHGHLHGSSHLPYLLFSLMCFSAIGFMIAELIAYYNTNPTDYVTAYRWRIVFALVFFMLLPRFIYHYTGTGPHWLVIGLSGYMLLLQFPNALQEYGSFFYELPVLHSKSLPWGETITIHSKQTTVLFAMSWLGILAIIFYTFAAASHQYLRGHRQPALHIMSAMLIFTLLLVENLLVATGKLNFIFLAQFGLPALIVIMGTSLHMTTQQQLEQSEGKFRTLFEAAGDAIVLLLDGHFIDCNHQALKTFSCKREELLGKSPIDFSPAIQYDGRESAVASMEKVQQAIRNGSTPAFPWLHTKLDGSEFDAEVTLSRIELDGQSCIQGIVRDVTERKRTEQDLYIKDRAMETASEGIVLTDARNDNKLIYVNQAMESLTGYQREELLGHNLRILQGTNTDPETVNEFRQAIETQQPYHVEILNYRKDGTAFWNDITITPVNNSQGEVTHYIGTHMDISDQRQTEEALRRSQKMEAIGQLAGGVAHDFNNQLGIIIGYLDFLRDHLAGSGKPDKWVETATQACIRCMDLTRQLLAFSRRKAKETTIVDLNSELAKMDTLIARAITPAITVQNYPADGLWPVAIDPGEFQDMILNLVINARDAMPHGGQLIIETSNKLVDISYASINPDLAIGEYVQVMVSDTGNGIDKTTLEHIFEPFFTTKEEGKGTGLGLAMVYGFAKRYEGDIKVYSEPDIGTTFRLYLPRAHDTISKKTESEAASSTVGGTETILIVDDEPDLLRLAQTYLQVLGYKTLTADSPETALDLLQQNTDIDLLFSDVVMPGNLNGYMLAEKARHLRPAIKVLLTSGFTAQTMAASGQPDLTANLLHKPYRRVDLARRVRTILDQAKQA